MAATRLLIRRLRELLRLKYEAGLSHRAIAHACAVGLGAYAGWVPLRINTRWARTSRNRQIQASVARVVPPRFHRPRDLATPEHRRQGPKPQPWPVFTRSREDELAAVRRERKGSQGVAQVAHCRDGNQGGRGLRQATR